MRFVLRRVRRRDFSELIGLYAACGQPVPVPDRATNSPSRHQNTAPSAGTSWYSPKARSIIFVQTAAARNVYSAV